MPPLVIYHANCRDGFCAVWVAKQALGEIEAVPAQYGQEPPDVAGRRVYILDFSYKRSVLEEMSRKAESILVLDHHKTAQAELEAIGRDPFTGYLAGGKTLLCIFDMEKSGGRLTWEHFFGDKPAPWLVDYTEDRDLWRWTLPESKTINAALRSYPLDFAVWNDLLKRSLAVLSVEGQSIFRREQQIIDDHLRHAREIEMEGHRILAVNATVLFSEIAGELARDRPFGACYFDRQDGKRQWSLRSRTDGVDVSDVAKRRGGGGHRNAAGFEEVLS